MRSMQKDGPPNSLVCVVVRCLMQIRSKFDFNAMENTGEIELTIHEL